MSLRRRSPCSAKRSCSANARGRNGGGAARPPIRRRSCAISPPSGPARRWCTKNMAWAATSACRSCRSRGRTASSSCSNTPAATSCTYPCSSCTSYRATRAPRRKARRCTSSAPINGPRARKRAADKIRDVAAELLDLYAQRQAKRGPALPTKELEYQAFANSFPFEETADQAEAIRQVLQDLASEKPMDRVVCGDVGFGKTEVAMRAAFVAAQAGKQVAVLVPTTLLAEQHTNNFRDRFADWPVRIESLSRFRSGKESNAVLEGIEKGTVDIVIATQKLLHAQRPIQGSRAHHRRRGTPLRRARQGEAQDAARRSARADADRDADPAHAEHGARRPARPVADHDAAGRAARHQDLRHRMARADAARSGVARVPPRRPGVLRAQRGRDHREDRARKSPSSFPRPRCASATARCASAISSS